MKTKSANLSLLRSKNCQVPTWLMAPVSIGSEKEQEYLVAGMLAIQIVKWQN